MSGHFEQAALRRYAWGKLYEAAEHHREGDELLLLEIQQEETGPYVNLGSDQCFEKSICALEWGIDAYRKLQGGGA